MKPIVKTYMNRFQNGQSCNLAFQSDDNGVRVAVHLVEPLRFEEIEDEYKEWRLRVTEDFTKRLPPEYQAAHVAKMFKP